MNKPFALEAHTFWLVFLSILGLIIVIIFWLLVQAKSCFAQCYLDFAALLHLVLHMFFPARVFDFLGNLSISVQLFHLC